MESETLPGKRTLFSERKRGEKNRFVGEKGVGSPWFRHSESVEG